MGLIGFEHDIQLGDTVEDEITGVRGVVVSVTRYIAQCDRVGVQPREVKDGKAVEPSWFDVVHLKVVERGTVRVSSATPKTGGPAPTPMRAADPR